jgi:hypothetical protein
MTPPAIVAFMQEHNTLRDQAPSWQDGIESDVVDTHDVAALSHALRHSASSVAVPGVGAGGVSPGVSLQGATVVSQILPDSSLFVLRLRLHNHREIFVRLSRE